MSGGNYLCFNKKTTTLNDKDMETKSAYQKFIELYVESICADLKPDGKFYGKLGDKDGNVFTYELESSRVESNILRTGSRYTKSIMEDEDLREFMLRNRFIKLMVMEYSRWRERNVMPIIK